MLNLILGILWLVGGLGILGYEAIYGPLPLRLLGTVSIGWVMLLLSAWNGVRLSMTRMADSEREANLRVEQARERQRRERRREEGPNPDFDFTNSPPSQASRPPESGPPGNP
jgi:hypothetical protein